MEQVLQHHPHYIEKLSNGHFNIHITEPLYLSDIDLLNRGERRHTRGSSYYGYGYTLSQIQKIIDKGVIRALANKISDDIYIFRSSCIVQCFLHMHSVLDKPLDMPDEPAIITETFHSDLYPDLHSSKCINLRYMYENYPVTRYFADINMACDTRHYTFTEELPLEKYVYNSDDKYVLDDCNCYKVVSREEYFDYHVGVKIAAYNIKMHDVYVEGCKYKSITRNAFDTNSAERSVCTMYYVQYNLYNNFGEPMLNKFKKFLRHIQQRPEK